ncbi:response regulator [Gillisia limnaea]|uniref:Response regulator receiver protein n=1 Tax=Gillisia limnaea (strain DSM 15749 / LMG 21470 / R-8282) TaxID=865937 RepID=H2BW08_GILLR|nr:response regulator [Gillisia limnaea]EHQ02925.1 response regulator receiver protein [Gillisia limnaea DSM 15749]
MNKILVVDDDRIIGEMLKFAVGSKGYFAVISNKPEQTVHNIFHNGIDLVMLDLFIFGVSGIEVCKELRENETTAQVPILMMSGLSGVKKKCLAAGATDFISKPFEMKTLFSKIETILTQKNV